MKWNEKIEPIVNKGIRIIAASLIIAEIACFLYSAYIIYTFDKTYPFPYIPAWIIPAALAMITFKTTIISSIIFGNWNLKIKEKKKDEYRKGDKEYKEKAGPTGETDEEQEKNQ